MKTLLLLFSLACACTLAVKRYDGHQVVEISPVTRGQKTALENFLKSHKELEVWRYALTPSVQADIRISPEEAGTVKQFLQVHNIPHRVKISNVQEAIDNQMKGVLNKNTRNVDFDDYNTLEDIEAYMIDLADSNSLVTLIEVGRSYEDRPIYTLRLSTDPDAERPSLFLNAAANPQEWISTAMLLNFINTFVTGYGEDEEITLLLDNLDFYMMPVFNVDGYEYTFGPDRLWRKTRSPNEGSECVGTDPNRNWGLEWGGDDNPCSYNYAGSEAFSEVEVLSVAQFVAGLQDCRAYLAYHSYGQVYLYPYGYTSEPIPDFDEVDETLNAAVDAAQAVHEEPYRAVSVNNAFGTIRGSSIDYTYGDLGILYSVGIDLRDQGEYGFLLPADQIAPTSEENLAALMVIANRILETVKSP